MLRRRRGRQQVSRPADPAAVGLARAERAYNLTQEAIGRADAKAATAITLELAALGALLTLATQGRGLPVPATLLGVTAALWLTGVGAAGLVVFPRLDRRAGRSTCSGVYFGELRCWTPQRLATHLTSQPEADYLRNLAGQVVAVARIAWRKHICLQASLALAAAGLLILAAGLLIGGGA